MYSGVGNVVGWGKTAKHIAYVIATHGLDTVYGGTHGLCRRRWV